jgi:Flp pilus assembly CpaE family ATPase
MPASILIIDGDAASRNYLAVMLGKSGYTVLSASLGREGLISAWKDHPDAIILDPVLPDMAGLDLLGRLRQDPRTAGVPCVVLSSREDSQEMLALLAAGCNEYIVKSGQALTLLLDILPRLMRVDSTPKKHGSLITFLSAKGGLGTSSLCANLAMCVGSAQLEKRVAVLDLVLPLGSIADIVGSKETLDLAAAAEDPGKSSPAFFRESLPRVPDWYFHLLAGPRDPEAGGRLTPGRLEAVLGALLESHDYVFADIGRSLSAAILPILRRASVIVLVVGTDLDGVRLTQVIWNYLKERGVNPQRVYVLQNRMVETEGLTKAEVEQMLGLPVRLTMPYLGGDFTLANDRHEPLAAKYPSETAALTLQEAARAVVEMAGRGKSA